MAQMIPTAMTAPYDLLLGRCTYDGFAAHWTNTPSHDPIGSVLNPARKYVVTSDGSSLSWQNSHALSGNVVEQIKELQRRPGPLLQVHGSARLLKTLIVHDMVDEFRLWTFPVVVGRGKRLFESGAPPANYALVKSTASTSGVVMGVYRRGK